MTIREHYNQVGSKDEIEISVSDGIDAERRNFSGRLSRLVMYHYQPEATKIPEQNRRRKKISGKQSKWQPTEIQSMWRQEMWVDWLEETGQSDRRLQCRFFNAESADSSHNAPTKKRAKCHQACFGDADDKNTEIRSERQCTDWWFHFRSYCRK